MKHTPLKRTGSLKRSQLRSHPKRVDRTDPARIAWKVPHGGFCQCGCDRFALHLERHHIVALSTIRQEGRLDLEFDLRNSLLLHPHCHSWHTDASRRIPLAAVPSVALDFAVELLGRDRAALYMARFYAPSRIASAA